jgi:predicted transcriptional regulator
MATLSVKLPETTKTKLQKHAKAQGTTAHALMVSAIDAYMEKSDQKLGFMQQALASQKKTLKSGEVFEGAALSHYLKAKVRGENKPKRPTSVQLRSIKTEQA